MAKIPGKMSNRPAAPRPKKKTSPAVAPEAKRKSAGPSTKQAARRRAAAVASPRTVSVDATMSPDTGAAVTREVGISEEARATAVADVRFLFPPEWETERQEVIRLLGDLPQAIDDADPALRLAEQARQWADDRGGIGHNQPPERIEILPSADEIVTEATVAGEALLEEIRSDRPHRASIRLAARALRRVAGWVGTVVAWTGKKADAFLDEFLKQLAKPAAIATAAAIGAMLLGLQPILATIIAHVLSLIGHL